MASVDINPFEGVERPASREHDRTESRQQEASFRGESQRTSLMKDYVKDLYKKLSENICEIPEPFHCDYFKLVGGELYHIGSRKPLMTEGKLRQTIYLSILYVSC